MDDYYKDLFNQYPSVKVMDSLEGVRRQSQRLVGELKRYIVLMARKWIDIECGDNTLFALLNRKYSEFSLWIDVILSILSHLLSVPSVNVKAVRQRVFYMY